VSEEDYPSLRILPSALAEGQGDRPFVAIVRSRDELCRWLRDPLPGLKWLQVEGMLGDSDALTEAARSVGQVFGRAFRHLDSAGLCVRGVARSV